MLGLDELIKLNRGKNYKADERRIAAKIAKSAKRIAAYQEEIQLANERDEKMSLVDSAKRK